MVGFVWRHWILSFKTEHCVFSVMSDSLRPHGLWPARLLHPWDFFRQQYCSGMPFPPPGYLPDPGREPVSPVLVGDSILYHWAIRKTPNRTLAVLLNLIVKAFSLSLVWNTDFQCSRPFSEALTLRKFLWKAHVCKENFNKNAVRHTIQLCFLWSCKPQDICIFITTWINSIMAAFQQVV